MKVKHTNPNNKLQKGITLIALVITIIVLLILAGVSIAMLTGDNGIIGKAKDAKNETIVAQEKELIQIAYVTALSKKTNSNNVTAEELEEELNNLNANAITNEEETQDIKVTFLDTNNEYIVDQEGNISDPINVEDTEGPKVEIEVGKITGKSIEVKVKAEDASGIKGYKYYLGGEETTGIISESKNKYSGLKEITEYELKVEVTDKRGNVGQASTKAKTIYTLATGKTLGKVSNNTKMSDENEDILTLPAGFQISGETADEVENGVVIEDAINGNQFVWIPVTDESKYVRDRTFEHTYISDGHALDDVDYLPNGLQQEGKTEGEIEKETVLKAGGFYISRFEAGAEGGTYTNDQWTDSTKLVSKQGVTVWNYIKQEECKTIAKTFINNNNVKSALISGIQWDVVMKFVDGKLDGNNRTFDVTVYDSNNKRTTGNEAKSGENIADKVCNIYDLEGNHWEYVAEKNDCGTSDGPYINRANCYGNPHNAAASSRGPIDGGAGMTLSFRFVLYIM